MGETLSNMLDREPFQPFRIITTGGATYEVAHPHLVAIMHDQVFYCWPRSNRHAFIPFGQISSVEPVQAAA